MQTHTTCHLFQKGPPFVASIMKGFWCFKQGFFSSSFCYCYVFAATHTCLSSFLRFLAGITRSKRGWGSRFELPSMFSIFNEFRDTWLQNGNSIPIHPIWLDVPVSAGERERLTIVSKGVARKKKRLQRLHLIYQFFAHAVSLIVVLGRRSECTRAATGHRARIRWLPTYKWKDCVSTKTFQK